MSWVPAEDGALPAPDTQILHYKRQRNINERHHIFKQLFGLFLFYIYQSTKRRKTIVGAARWVPRALLQE